MAKYYQKPQDWIPTDNFILEENALKVAKSHSNQLVVAGPGAGKTELLAQRACFLLQTNSCSYPKRILAISFKRDAANNLKERVSKRVDKSFSHRFTSMTFDAFAKSLIDRFRNAIPQEYRPYPDYKIFTNPMVDEIFSIFNHYDPYLSLDNYNDKLRYIRSLTRDKYPLKKGTLESKVLLHMIKRESKSFVTFPIISRLAQYLISSNPKIKSFLQQTYSHIFLDEFQDTTYLQYEFLLEIFSNSERTLTAVGDSKQRIMLWAGAMRGIFKAFQEHFNASEVPLFMNFRSAPRLVNLQNHLVRKLMKGNIASKPIETRDQEEGIAEFWIFKNFEQEAKVIAKEIGIMINKQKVSPREICFLYKQKPEKYSVKLQEELLNQGIQSRIENDFQDILLEPLIQFLLNLILAALLPRAHEEKEYVLNQYLNFRRISDDSQALELEKELLNNLKELRTFLKEEKRWEHIQKELESTIEAVSYDVFYSLYQQYNDKVYFDSLLEKFFKVMEQYFQEEGELLSATHKFLGKSSIPIMTIHKSKGLEFEIVFFIGFEDQNFWAFHKQQEEDTCSFFVALSRAKEAVYFTFSQERINNFGSLEPRSFHKINPLVKALKSSRIVLGRRFDK